MRAFLTGYILWTMMCSIFETVCLRMAWGPPWVHGPVLVLQLGLFAWALRFYHLHYSNN